MVDCEGVAKSILISKSVFNEGKRGNTSPKVILGSRAACGIFPPLTAGCGTAGDICGDATRGFDTAGAARFGEEIGPPGGIKPNWI